MKDFLKLIFFGVVKTSKLEMFNPANGERKSVSSNSFDLTVLLVGGFFGLPLFFKRLWGWAWLMFALTTVQLLSFYEKLKQVLNARRPKIITLLPKVPPRTTRRGRLCWFCPFFCRSKPINGRWSVC